MLYAINLDISEEKRDYTALYEKIKSFGSWMHYVYSTWLIVPTDEDIDAEKIANELRPLLDEDDDYFLIVKLDSPDYHGLLPPAGWLWLQDALGQRERDLEAKAS